MPFKQSRIVNFTFSPMSWMLMKRAVDGAQVILFASMCESEKGVSGKHYAYVLNLIIKKHAIVLSLVIKKRAID